MPVKCTHIADTSALIAYLKGEDGHDKFAALLMEDCNVIGIHATTLCDLYYHYLRLDGLESAEEARAKVTEILGVIEDMDADFLRRVARWKADYELPFSYAFAAATAEQYGCCVVTIDRDGYKGILTTGTLQITCLR